MLDVTVWRQKGSMTVHLVNLTNPMMMKGPLRELIPTPPQKVTVRLPAGTRARNVHLLMAKQTPAVQQSNGALTLTVPSVLGSGSGRDRPGVAARCEISPAGAAPQGINATEPRALASCLPEFPHRYAPVVQIRP